MTLSGVMVVTLRFRPEFGKPAFQHAPKKESSRSLSHLLMSFLFIRFSVYYWSISEI